MKNRRLLFAMVVLAVVLCSCNFEQVRGTLSQSDIQTLSAQTVAAIQWQTLSASQGGAGNTAGATSGSNPAPTDTMMPSVTPTSTYTSTPTSTFTPTPTPIPCYRAHFVADVTIPDGWGTTPNDHFTKTWRLQNNGSCTWTSGYSLIYDHGTHMGEPASQQLTPGTVAPGATIDVSVNLLSPATVGTYQTFFMLRASDSTVFGVGEHADTAIWVKIVVTAPAISTNQVQNSISIANGEVNVVSVPCPAGSVVVGGGFDGGTKLSAAASGQNSNGWAAGAKNYSGSSQTLTVYAICLTGATATTTGVTGNTTLSGGVSGAATVACPAGSVITGEGFAFNPDTIFGYGNNTSGNNSRAFGRNKTGSNQTLAVFATCLTATGATSVQGTNSTTVSAGSTIELGASCPAGTVVTGGGFTLTEPLFLLAISKEPGANMIVARVYNPSGSPLALNVYAQCLAIS